MTPPVSRRAWLVLPAALLGAAWLAGAPAAAQSPAPASPPATALVPQSIPSMNAVPGLAPMPPPAPPAPPAADTAKPASPPPAAAPLATAPAPAQVWEPRPAGEFRALNKISTAVTPITMRVGQSVQYGSLTITLRSCVVHPADEPADAAAFLDITDSRPGGPGFHGWMFAAEPEVAMLEHPVYDIRFLGCRN